MRYRFTKDIVGTDVIIEEQIKSEWKTKNILTQKIVRKTINCIVLECGHKILVTRFNKVPSNRTDCRECIANENIQILLDAGMKFESSGYGYWIFKSNDRLIKIHEYWGFWNIRTGNIIKKEGVGVLDLIKECKGNDNE